MKTDQDILNRALSKQAEFDKSPQISLVGHSLFDMWADMEQGTPNLAGRTVANLGLSGTSTRQYLDVIVKGNLIKQLGDDVFLFLGVNDIVKEPDYSPKQVLDWLLEIVDHFRRLSPTSRYYLLEATPVNNIATTDNADILLLNQYIEVHCPADIRYVKTWNAFANQEGKLDLNLCHDGLHFTQQGYDVLEKILLEQLGA
ncbi:MULTISPECIES: SGNH/GDSL hydrolase family protein [Glaesserella]|uniref:Acylneuraminate cytidylyltransferase n=1 Tax=Glaesserella australis TaxID=2094024 RepID=A0A328C005_9PAST|nr:MULTISPECIES: SGNH/GDSL hydrolase family protein [Glaesserella]AUI66897.1 acylneuraminate cytidylyltransferase [Glaesserella sp. 15-184]RAL19948.1 acylneuraminate cytidylyltransferase [Glaesserella australis]